MHLHRTHPHRSPVRSVLLGAAGVLLGLGLLATPAVAQSAPSAQAADGGDVMESITLRLRHADPFRVKSMLADVLDDRFSLGKISRSGDRRSVFGVSGPGNQLPAIQTLVDALDVPANRSAEDLALEFYDTGDATDRSLVVETLIALTNEDASERFSVSAHGMASVFAAPETHGRIAAGLEKLKAMSAARASDPAAQTPEADAPTDVLVRLTWLVTSASGDDGRAVGSDMAAVVRQLEGLGLEGWREFGRTSVLASHGAPFSIRTNFTPTNAGAWSMQWAGLLESAEDGRSTLANDASLRHQSGEAAVDLSTTIELAPGRRVVLGLTPVLDVHSVLVIEVTAPLAE